MQAPSRNKLFAPRRARSQPVSFSLSPAQSEASMSQTLNYRGAAGMDDAEAFNARTTLRWKGDMLFRIFFYNDRLFFIKVGGSKQNQAAIHFGLIGAIVNHFAQKRAARKTQEKIASIAGIAPSTLLGQDKVNSAIEVSQITEPTL